MYAYSLSSKDPSDLNVNWRPPVQGGSSPVQVKEPYTSLHDYLLAFILQNRCVQCTPAHNPREREGVAVCIERKKKRLDKSYAKEPLLVF